MESGFNRDNLLNILKNSPNDFESEESSLSSSRTIFSENEELSDDSNSSLSDDYESKEIKLMKKVEKYNRKLGLNSNYSKKSKKKKKDKTQKPKKIKEKRITIDELEEEEDNFNKLTYPLLVIDGSHKIEKTKNINDQERLLESFEKLSISTLEDMLSDFSRRIPEEKERKIVNQMKKDMAYEDQRNRKTKKHDIYKDLNYFESLNIFSIRWKNIILMDPNVEIPFIYLQTLQTASVGGLKDDFVANIMMLEAYGMTVQVIAENHESCNYRAYFTGKIPDKKKDQEENVIKDIINERNLNNRFSGKQYQGGLSGSSMEDLLKTKFEKPDHYYTEKDRILHLKTAQKRATAHEQPLPKFNPKLFDVDESIKREKRRDDILKIQYQMNKIDQSFEGNEDEEEENDLNSSSSVDIYNSYLNGFTQNLMNSLVKNCQFINEKSVDAISRKSTEISAWIENYLCVDICVFPGLRENEDERIERQLLFVFNISTQNPFTFLLHHLVESEREELLKNK